MHTHPTYRAPTRRPLYAAALVAACLACGGVGIAAERAATAAPPAAPTAPAAKPDPRVELVKRIPGAKVEDLRPSPVAGVYELRDGAEFSYVTSDGKFVFGGDLYRLKGQGELENVSEERRREVRLRMMAEVPESQMLVFAPRAPRYTITVFTDVDCSWCQRLHTQIAEYNKLGVKVRYMFYPRTGPDTASWHKAEQVWCAPNRNEALTRAKLGEPSKDKACSSTPVRRHYELGRAIGVEATPGLLMPDGELHLGYLDPPALLQQLQAAH